MDGPSPQTPMVGAYSASPDSLAGLRGPTSKRREGKRGEGRYFGFSQCWRQIDAPDPDESRNSE